MSSIKPFTTISSKYRLTCGGYLKTNDAEKLGNEYMEREGLSGRFPREIKAVSDAVYVFPKHNKSFIRIQRLDGMERKGEWKWSMTTSRKVDGGTSVKAPIVTVIYKAMQKFQSKYEFTGLEKKMWHLLESNLVVVQYKHAKQAPKPSKKQPKAVNEEEKLKLVAIFKEMTDLPEMIDSLPEDEEEDTFINTDFAEEQFDMEFLSQLSDESSEIRF